MKVRRTWTVDDFIADLVDFYASEQQRSDSSAVNHILYQFFKSDPELRKRLKEGRS